MLACCYSVLIKNSNQSQLNEADVSLDAVCQGVLVSAPWGALGGRSCSLICVNGWKLSLLPLSVTQAGKDGVKWHHSDQPITTHSVCFPNMSASKVVKFEISFLFFVVQWKLNSWMLNLKLQILTLTTNILGNTEGITWRQKQEVNQPISFSFTSVGPPLSLLVGRAFYTPNTEADTWTSREEITAASTTWDSDHTLMDQCRGAEGNSECVSATC